MQHGQARMLHITLLNLECLVVVVFNMVAWRTLDIHQSEIMSPKSIEEPSEITSDSAHAAFHTHRVVFRQHSCMFFVQRAVLVRIMY